MARGAGGIAEGIPAYLEHATLPKFDGETTHVIAAEVTFADGYIVRRELVIESTKSYSTGTQLTPIAVRQTAEQHPPSWEGCFVHPDGRAVRTTAVESPDAVVIVVRAPDPHEGGSVFNPVLQEFNKGSAEVRLPELLLAPGTVERMLWPVGEKYGRDPESASYLFVPSLDYDASKQEFMHFLMSQGPPVADNEPLRFADAVAVAGIRAMTGAQRRAVVLVLSHKPDASMHSPQAVRRYLAALGVPLFVWSPMGETPKTAAGWGEVEDVSSVHRLGLAVARLRRTLAEQRIAWVNQHKDAVLRHYGLPGPARRWKVHGRIVVDVEVMSPYITDSPVEAMSFSALERELEKRSSSGTKSRPHAKARPAGKRRRKRK